METQSIPLTHILPHPENPRGEIALDAPDIVSLAEEIAEAKTLYHALNVVPEPERESYFRVVAGHRRRAAVLRLGWESVAVIVRDWDEKEQRRVMVAENVKRADLTPLQEGRAYEQLRADYGDYSEVARVLGMVPATIHNRVAILKLSSKVQELYDGNEMPTAAIAHLAKIADHEQQARLALRVFNRNCTVKQLQQIVTTLNGEKSADGQAENKPAKPAKAESKNAAQPVKLNSNYCRTDADADLARLNGSPITFVQIRTAMVSACERCGQGKYPAICSSCELPKFIQRLVTNHEQGQA
jgi:ParB family transcriptional regulator, chromosome partitioning protein